MKNLITIFICCMLYSGSAALAQLTIKDQESSPNTLLQVNDEGNAGSITLPQILSMSTSTNNKLYNIGSSLYWNGTPLGVAGSAGGWTDDGSVVRLSSPTDKVGIGTSSPSAGLHVVNNNGFIFKGEFGSGMSLPSEIGERMIWYPRKGAFRVGAAYWGEWDDSNIGQYSFGAGAGSKASGNSSAAIGTGSTATGENAISIGALSVASGDNSATLGGSLTADSYYSLAVGYRNIGGGSKDTWIETDPLFEIGNGHSSYPDKSNALTVLKNGNVGIGTVQPNVKLSLGTDFTAKKLALWDGTNDFYGFGVAAGRITFYTNNSEKMTIKDNGNVGIATDNPTAKLHVEGDVKIGSGGVKFSEIIELIGTTGTNRTDISYPSGYDKTNTRVISYQVVDFTGPTWVTGYDGLWVALDDSVIKLGHESNIFNGQSYRLMLMKIE